MTQLRSQIVKSKRNIVVPFSKVYVTFLSQWVLNFARGESTKSDHIKTILGLHSTLVFIEKLQQLCPKSTLAGATLRPCLTTLSLITSLASFALNCSDAFWNQQEVHIIVWPSPSPPSYIPLEAFLFLWKCQRGAGSSSLNCAANYRMGISGRVFHKMTKAIREGGWCECS